MRITEWHSIPNLVRQSDVCVIGEAPGENEIIQRRPFCGASGYLLDGWLTLQGISRASLFVTNVIGDRIAKIPTSEDKRLLFEELKIVRPKVILAVGELAMNTLTGLKGVTKWRGSVIWRDDMKCKIIPMIHPAAVMRNWGFWPLSASDIGKIKDLEYIRPKYNFIEEATETDLFHHFKVDDPILVFDVETVHIVETTWYSKLVRLGIGNDERSEEHTSELQSHSFISYAVFCLKKKNI